MDSSPTSFEQGQMSLSGYTPKRESQGIPFLCFSINVTEIWSAFTSQFPGPALLGKWRFFLIFSYQAQSEFEWYSLINYINWHKHNKFFIVKLLLPYAEQKVKGLIYLCINILNSWIINKWTNDQLGKENWRVSL